jgi:hypothetical protein
MMPPRLPYVADLKKLFAKDFDIISFRVMKKITQPSEFFEYALCKMKKGNQNDFLFSFES